MTHKKQPVALAESVQAALFTGLITVGAYIAVPLPVSPIPIVLQNFFVLLAALLLPVRWATASVALYLALGAVGLPVFAAARGGLAHFAGPTGGYLIGFLPAVAVASLIAGAPAPHTRLRHDVAAVTTATVLVYAVGTPWMAVVMDMNAPAALAAGVLPFLPGDALKAVAAVLAARAVRPLLGSSSGPQAGGEDRS